MTLLELLVQELPKRGGWPENSAHCYREKGNVSYWFGSAPVSPRYGDEIIIREQYEAAIKQPEWNGDGLPPVGTKVSFLYGTYGWIGGTIAAYDGNTAIVRHNDGYAGCSRSEIQTKADRQRDQAVKSIYQQSGIRARDGGPTVAENVYDAIVAHKISGVTTVPSVGEIIRATESCSREDAQKIVDLLNGA